jgi:hypothetical protein
MYIAMIIILVKGDNIVSFVHNNFLLHIVSLTKGLQLGFRVFLDYMV